MTKLELIQTVLDLKAEKRELRAERDRYREALEQVEAGKDNPSYIAREALKAGKEGE